MTSKTLNREAEQVFQGINENTGAANTAAVLHNLTWYNYAPNEEYVYKNNWAKLRELALGYRFKMAGIPSVREVEIGLYGRNLFLWTKIPHVDPESSSFGTGNAQGATRFAFPTTRSFGLNFRIQF